MPEARSDAETWRRLVLQSMPLPAWLAEDGPERDVVLSSRVRVMRNLRGLRFPHHAPVEELESVQVQVVGALRGGTENGIGDFRAMSGLSPAEREYLVNCRLVSPDFEWQSPGRSLLLDKDRAVSVMVNEEDHVRLQAIAPGWAVERAEELAKGTLARIAASLEFAQSERFGYLAASPYNSGTGTRRSAMFHLIGLAHAKRLPQVLAALSDRGLIARGLFGEASRAVGAFVQVSITSGPREGFAGAGAYLLEHERQAREGTSRDTLGAKLEESLRFVQTARGVSLGEALRVLGWVRWAAAVRLSGIKEDPREIDSWLTTMELRTTSDPSRASRQRSDFLRERLGL